MARPPPSNRSDAKSFATRSASYSAETFERRAHLGQRNGKSGKPEEIRIECGERHVGLEHGDTVADAVERRLQDLRLPPAHRFRLPEAQIAAHEKADDSAKDRKHEQRTEKRRDQRRTFQRFGSGRPCDQQTVFFCARRIEQAMDLIQLHDDYGDQATGRRRARKVFPARMRVLRRQRLFRPGDEKRRPVTQKSLRARLPWPPDADCRASGSGNDRGLSEPS